MNQVEANISYLNQCIIDLSNAFDNHQKKNLNEETNRLIEENNGLNEEINHLLHTISAEFINYIDQEANLREAEKRICKQLFHASGQKFQDLMCLSMKLELELKNKNLNNAYTSAEIVLGRSLTKEEKEQIQDNPAKVEQLRQDKLQGQAHSSVTQALDELNDRHKALIKLGNSIEKLTRLINDLHGLIFLQGGMVDDIYQNISEAKENINDGSEYLGKAIDHSKAARKKKIIILIIIIVAAGIILTPILIKLL